MNNSSRQILKRRLEYLRSSGCDFKKLHEYFGYKDSEHHVRKISMSRDPSIANVFTLTIKQNKRDVTPLQTYMDGLPRDVNNVIYSYLSTNREIKYVIELPSDFPFQPMKWSLISFVENGVSKTDDGINPNDMYCGKDFSPAMSFDLEILLHLSRIPWLH